MYGLDDDQLQKLLGFTLPEEQKFQAQDVPQLQQGLLGAADTQNQQLQGLIQGGNQAAAQLGQMASQPVVNENLAQQRMAATQQQAQQSVSKQNQDEAQFGALLGKIAAMFIPGGAGLGGYIKGRLGA